MEYRLKPYGILEYGTRKDAEGRPHQEDCIFPALGKSSPDDRLFILCDGMGGHDAGEVASATVCEVMSRHVLDALSANEGRFSQEIFEQALQKAYDALDARDTGAEKKMGTTLTFLLLHEGGAFMAHMGDSRIYHIRPGKSGDDTELLYESSDHSLVNDLVKVGELTRKEARESKQKNVITRALQPNTEKRLTAEIHTTDDIRPGDYFYLCSDGMLEQPEMEDGTTLKNIFSRSGGKAENKVKILRKVTNTNDDNHSAIIVHVSDVVSHGSSPESAEEEDTDIPARKSRQEGGRSGRSILSYILMAVALAVTVFLVFAYLL